MALETQLRARKKESTLNTITRRTVCLAIVMILLLAACAPAPAPAATQNPAIVEELIGLSVALTLTLESSQVQNQQLIDQSVAATVVAIEAEATRQQELMEAQATPTATPLPQTGTSGEPAPESSPDPNAPVILSISPNTGISGSIVTITGKNFISGQGHTQFYFGDHQADPLAVLCRSTTQCRVVVPFGAEGNVKVRAVNQEQIVAPGGSADTFFYTDPDAPIVENIKPQEGSFRGGTRVIVTGNNFNPGRQGVDSEVTRFFFGGNEASDVICTSERECRVTSPPGEEGYVVVEARNLDGASQHIPGNDFDGFKYNGIPKYGCGITTVAPQNLALFRTGESFVVRWIVTNIGENTWPAGLDVKYSSSANMGVLAFDEIPVSLKPKESYPFRVHAVAPDDPGKYYLTWNVQGMGCQGTVAIVVD